MRLLKYNKDGSKIQTGSSRKGEKVFGIIKKKKVVETKKGLFEYKEVEVKRSFKKSKSLPKGCKTAKRICIKCLTNSISKNDSNYESKICKSCT